MKAARPLVKVCAKHSIGIKGNDPAAFDLSLFDRHDGEIVVEDAVGQAIPDAAKITRLSGVGAHTAGGNIAPGPGVYIADLVSTLTRKHREEAF